jgi:serine/threonine protein kinase
MTDLTTGAFVELVARSRLLDAARIHEVAARLHTPTARQLADELVRAGELTQFQANKLLNGHWRGLVVGPYRVLAPLGRGGMGTVYLARDTRLTEGRDEHVLVALKVLPPRIAREEPRMLARFQREIEIGQRFSHPNVARTLDGGEVDGVNYLVMEYIPGQTLRDIVTATSRLTVGGAARVFADVAAGLSHIHECGLIHRDLKPGNVMVTTGGRAKLLDLGLALVLGEPRPDDHAILGGKGYILGTMDFISPEQASDATAVGFRSDLYSLGCTLYFAMTGSPPFPGGTSRDKIRWQKTLEPRPLTDFNPAVPAEFVAIVKSLMAKTPAERPVSAEAVRELLLPFAVAAADKANLSLSETVGAVDTPKVHPDLWVEGGSEAEPLPLDEKDYPSWLVPVVVAGGIGVLVVLLTLLRRL